MSDERYDSHNTLSVLIHAASKAGKSTLMSSAPPPILVLDVEGSWKFIRRMNFDGPPLRTVTWNPTHVTPPIADGTWDVARVNVRTWDTLTLTYRHLTQSSHGFRSIVIDSITETQRKLRENLRGTEQMRMADWGDLLVYMDKWIRDMRDLTLIPQLGIVFVGFVAETRFRDGKWRPTMQGAIKDSLPYWVDVEGYLFTDLEPDETGAATRKVKKLLIMSDHPQFEAGERVQGALPDIVIRPHLTEMYHTVYPNTPQEDSK